MAVRVGDRAPDFELPGIDGETHSLSDLLAANKAVAVVFSCNHCPYVRAWEDRIVKAQADYGDRGLAIAAVNANDATKYPEDSFDSMRERAAERGFNFLYLHDESQAVARAYGAERTPEIFLLDAAGVVRYHGAPDDNYEDASGVKQAYFPDAIEAVLAGGTPDPAETPAVGCTIKWK